jgi:mRNA interferase MazF
MARVLRGDIVWADLEPTRGNEQAGQCPVLILSEDVFNDRSGTVIAIALIRQTQKAGFPLTLELFDAKLPKRSWAKISQIRTLSVQRLKKKIGKASAGEMDQVVEGLNELIGGTG